MHGVGGRRGHRAVKANVVDQEGLRVVEGREHSRDLFGHRGQMVTGDPLGGETRRADLEHAPRLEHLVAGEAVKGGQEAQGLGAEPGRTPGHEGPGAVARLHHAHAGECLEAGPDGRTAHPDIVGELALRGELAPGLEPSLLDEHGHVAHDVLDREPLARTRLLFPSRFRLATYSSARNARASALHHPLHLRQGHHRGIARRGHGQSAVSRAALDRVLWTLVGEKAVDEPGGERVASSHPVEDLQVLAPLRLVELAFVPADGSPVVEGRGLGVAQGSGDDREIREGRDRLSIMRPNCEGSRAERSSPGPGTAKPSAAVKSSSLPSITSTNGARSRFTSWARFWPPIDFQSDAR